MRTLPSSIAGRLCYPVGFREEDEMNLAKIFILSVLLAPSSVFADRCVRSLSKLQEYTVLSVTTVDGEFLGCDFNKIIRFSDGKTLRCSSYSYMYSFMPDAVIFAKQATYQGKSFATIKVLIEGEIFDMEPILLK
jgi:hypothetical protein